MKKKPVLLIVTILAAAGVFLFLFLSGVFFMPVTGRVSDKAYREERKSFYRREEYGVWERGTLLELPAQDINMGLDIRSYDISALDLTDQEAVLSGVTYDSATVFPDRLPNGFDPERIMEIGKNPGLGIRTLHEKGITGKGISIAIVDQALNPDHTEYADQLISYELLHCCDTAAQMHGSAVTSIAVGKNCGVAPDAKVYYIASTFGRYGSNGMKMNLQYMADGIDRILEINTLLPEDRKIRVISISPP